MKITGFMMVVSLATILALDAYAETNHNAVLICGTTVESGKSSEDLWWDGGREDPPTDRDEFWNDLYLMWEILYATDRYSLYIPPGTPPAQKHLYDHISVLYGDGNEYRSKWIRYKAEKYPLERITDDDARKNSVTDIFDTLSDTMTNQDNLFVYTGNHGQPAHCFRTLNVSDPELPWERGHYFPSPPAYPDDERHVFVSGDYAYVARLERGINIIDISSPPYPDSVGSFNTPGEAWGVYVSGNRAYVADLASLQILNVSNPTNPKRVTQWGDTVHCRKQIVDVWVSGGYAYVLNRKPCLLYVLDVSDPSHPDSIATWTSPEPQVSGYGIYCYGSRVYVAQGLAGLQVVDVADPSDPHEVGHYEIPGGRVFGVHVGVNYAYVAAADSGLRIVESSSLTEVGHCKIEGQYARNVYVVEPVQRDLYTYAYVAYDLAGLQIVDVSTPTDPELKGCFNRPFSVWDVHCQDEYAYIVGIGADDQVFLGLWPPGTVTRDIEFASQVNLIPCAKRVFLMNQCFAGGFINDLTDNKTVMITACKDNQIASTADDIPWQDIDEWQSSPDAIYYESFADTGSENEVHNDSAYHHGELGLHVMNALRCSTLSSENRPSVPTYADLNEDLLISIEEAFKYAVPGLDSLPTRDSWQYNHFGLFWGLMRETPQYDDPGDIGPSTFLGWDDGDPPARPTGLQDTCVCPGIQKSGSQHVGLYWGDNTEPDMVGYNVYRNADKIAATRDSKYIDYDVGTAAHTYEVTAFDLCANESESESIRVSLICGDPNADGAITVADANYLVAFIYTGGPEPACPPFPYSCCGDVNVDGRITIADPTYIISYIYRGGPPPCEPEGRSSSEEYAEVGLSTLGTEDDIVELSVFAQFDVPIAAAHVEIVYDQEVIEMLDPLPTLRSQGLELLYDLSLRPGYLTLGMLDLEGQNHIEPGKGPILTLRLKNKHRDADLKTLCLQEAIFVDMDARELHVNVLDDGSVFEGGPQSSDQPIALLPPKFELSSSYPNPFETGITLCYALPRTTKVTIAIYDVSGTLVRTLVDRIQEPGYYRTYWKGRDFRERKPSSGVYFVRMEAEEFNSTRKVVLVR